MSTVAERQRRATQMGGAALRFLRDLARSWAGLIGLVLVGVLLIAVVFAPLITPHGPADQEVAARLQGPSGEYWLGTDHLGRDLYTRAVFGARIAMSVALPAGLLSLVVGLVLGLTAGFWGGRVDSVLTVVMDAMQSFPAVILALALLMLLGPSLPNVIIVVAIAFAPAYARMARASTFVIREQSFIEAEHSLGASKARIVGVHILPNVIPPLFILMAINIPVAVTVEAGLSFLGLGVPPPEPSWGVMLDEGFRRIQDTAWPVVVPAIALMLTTLGFTFLGEALRDRLDPRLSGVQGARGA